ncbi:MAG: hypothetical protein OEN22_07010 [Gammaproteobacteria bacterium]|nr:hypothetical protein [Gammaproteobacteria bacterium]
MTRYKLLLVALLASLLALPVSSAMAGGLSAVINGKSNHVDSRYEWNEDNYGFGLEYALTSRSRWQKVVMANGFRDSNQEMSYMAGAGLHRRLLETDRFAGFYIDAGVNAFVMTRKDVNGNRPFPGLLPSVSIGNRHAGFNITYLPKKAIEDFMDVRMQDPTLSGILFLQFKVNVDRLLPND